MPGGFEVRGDFGDLVVQPVHDPVELGVDTVRVELVVHRVPQSCGPLPLRLRVMAITFAAWWVRHRYQEAEGIVAPIASTSPSCASDLTRATFGGWSNGQGVDLR